MLYSQLWKSVNPVALALLRLPASGKGVNGKRAGAAGVTAGACTAEPHVRNSTSGPLLEIFRFLFSAGYMDLSVNVKRKSPPSCYLSNNT